MRVMPSLGIALPLAVVLLACSGSDATTSDGLVVGDWRVYSQTLFYDAGGSGGSDASASTTNKLRLTSDGRWKFGSSRGSWYVTSIDPATWERWGIQPYGPELKIVLDGWSGQSADGPIEAQDGRVDFLWVIYRAAGSSPGTVHMKFGHP